MSTTQVSQVSQELNTQAPVEFSILPDGKVRLYSTNRGRVFSFIRSYCQGVKPTEWKIYSTGAAAIFEKNSMSNEILLDLSLYCKSSNWERLAKKTDVVTNKLFTAKGNPRKLNTILKESKKEFAAIDQQIDQEIAERKAEKEAQSQA